MWYIFLLFALCAGDTSSKFRIRGGEEIDISEVPSVVYLSLDNDTHLAGCGGTILDKTHILTAAHCLDDIFPLTARMGSNYRFFGGVKKKAVAYIKHAQYDNDTLDNDIAIIKLESDIEFGNKIQPATLPQNAIAVGQEVTVPGWGKTGKPVVGRKHLMAIKVPRTEDEPCSVAFGYEVTDLVFCAGSVDVPKLIGDGDSGGPALVVQTVYGISSFSGNYVSGFTNVLSYVPWINGVFDGTYPLQPFPNE